MVRRLQKYLTDYNIRVLESKEVLSETETDTLEHMRKYRTTF